MGVFFTQHFLPVIFQRIFTYFVDIISLVAKLCFERVYQRLETGVVFIFGALIRRVELDRHSVFLV